MKSLFLFSIFLCFEANAFTIRPELNYQFFQKYEVENNTNDFESNGVGFGVSFFSVNDSLSAYGMSDMPWEWLTGFGLQYTTLKTKSTNGVPLLLPESFDADVIKLQAIVGFSIYGWRWEFPISGVYLKEKTAPNENDEKYGLGVGLQWLYPLSTDLLLGLGFEHLVFENGKNASTGQQGSLANSVTMSGPRFTIAYNFHWSTL